MRSIARLGLVASFVCLVTLRAYADEPLRYHEPKPGAAIGAAFLNVIQVPARLVATSFFGVLGGFTGFMLGGDRQSAWDVWNIAGGDQVVTPDMLQRRQAYKFTSFDPRR